MPHVGRGSVPAFTLMPATATRRKTIRSSSTTALRRLTVLEARKHGPSRGGQGVRRLTSALEKYRQSPMAARNATAPRMRSWT
jgi:hypothetical protein